jgi:hypothetical protein
MSNNLFCFFVFFCFKNIKRKEKQMYQRQQRQQVYINNNGIQKGFDIDFEETNKGNQIRIQEFNNGKRRKMVRKNLTPWQRQSLIDKEFSTMDTPMDTPMGTDKHKYPLLIDSILLPQYKHMRHPAVSTIKNNKKKKKTKSKQTKSLLNLLKSSLFKPTKKRKQ